MTKKKKRFIIPLMVFGSIIVTAVTAVAVVFAVGFPWSMIYIGGMLSEDPPQPKVTYGEFPFRIVYEYNGERITVEDTLIIEHEGVKWNEGVGKYNVWNVSYESQGGTDKEYNKLILFSGFIEGNGSATIKFELGSCEYYMGLEEDDIYYQHFGIQPGDIVISSPAYTGPLSKEELYSEYNIEIIEKYISPPITEK